MPQQSYLVQLLFQKHPMRLVRSHFVFLLLSAGMIGFSLPAAHSAPPMAPSALGTRNEAWTAQTVASSQPMDLVIWVRPVGPDSAKVAIAYRQRVPQARVKQEIARLASEAGGVAEGVTVAEGSLQPKNLKRFPITTTAQFTLRQSPSIRDNAPVLQPYLSAFQQWNRVEMLVTGVALTPYNGVEKFDSGAYSVLLAQSGQGVYRYELDIRQHAGSLPPLVNKPKPSGVSEAPPAPTDSTSHSVATSSGPLLLILLGVGLIGFALGCLLLLRRGTTRSSARIVRR